MSTLLNVHRYASQGIVKQTFYFGNSNEQTSPFYVISFLIKKKFTNAYFFGSMLGGPIS